MARRKSSTKIVEFPPLPDLDKAAILALDLGRRTGWMYQSREGVRDSGVFELYDPAGIKKTYEDGKRFLALRAFVDGLDDQLQSADVVAFEEVNPATHLSKRAASLYAGFRGELLTWATLHNKVIVPIPVGTWKKLFCGNGAAKKKQVIDECVNRGFLPFDHAGAEGTEHDDNEADAIGIFHALFEIKKNQATVTDAKPKPKRKRATKRKKPATTH